MLNDDEVKELREFLAGLGAYLPENKMSYVWSLYKKVANSNEPQPCSCQSAAKLWVKALDTVRNYVKELDGQQ